MSDTHPQKTRPFSQVERMIAWRYLRARRAEGGVSVMTWISLVGITLAVFALIATLAVLVGAGLSLREAMPWANKAGGYVVGKLGTATVSHAELFGAAAPL